MKWYRAIVREDKYEDAVFAAIDYFSEEYQKATKDARPDGLLWTASQMIPGVMEYRWSQLQELEAIIEFLETRYAKTLHKHRKHYSEHYAKALSDRQAEKYAEAEDEVIVVRLLKNEVCLVRNQFLGLTKALDSLHFQIGNLTKLKTAGMEDATL